MSNKDLCIKLINGFREDELEYVAEMLRSVKGLAETKAVSNNNSNYSLTLGDDYSNEPVPKNFLDDEFDNKAEVFSVHDYTNTLSMELDIR